MVVLLLRRRYDDFPLLITTELEPRLLLVANVFARNEVFLHALMQTAEVFGNHQGVVCESSGVPEWLLNDCDEIEIPFDEPCGPFEPDRRHLRASKRARPAYHTFRLPSLLQKCFGTH